MKGLVPCSAPALTTRRGSSCDGACGSGVVLTTSDSHAPPCDCRRGGESECSHPHPDPLPLGGEGEKKIRASRLERRDSSALLTDRA